MEISSSSVVAVVLVVVVVVGSSGDVERDLGPAGGKVAVALWLA